MATVEAWNVLTSHTASGGGQQWMTQPTPLHTPHTPPYGADSHGEGLPCHSFATNRLCGVLAGDWPRLTHHRHHFCHVSSEPNPLKEAKEYVRTLL